MGQFEHIIIVVLLLCVLVYIVQRLALPEPFVWVAWVIVFLVSLVVLLPLVGIHTGIGLVVFLQFVGARMARLG